MPNNDLRKKEFILASGSKGASEMAAGGGSWDLKDPIFNSNQEAERERWRWAQAMKSLTLPPVTYFLQEGSTS